mmetsp:Transcript_123881/g.241279  ORF Transcript_123881/g.241279 Transcript_123881/m.241279 type:complete len:330 (+) Transcript_123881:96-1085(+)
MPVGMQSRTQFGGRSRCGSTPTETTGGSWHASEGWCSNWPPAAGVGGAGSPWPHRECGNSSWQECSWDEECEEDLPDPWYVDGHDLVLEPMTPKTHEFTLLLLHSCTGGPDDAFAFFHRLNLPFRGGIRVAVPCSPVRRENHYGRARDVNSWFEYTGENGVRFPSQLIHQRHRLLRLLDSERRRLPDGDACRLVIWGLSQGAALALDVALHASFTVGGVVALRGMALSVDSKRLPNLRTSANPPCLELLAINGERDWICPPCDARKSYEAWRPHGVSVHFEEQPGLAHACARGRQVLSAGEMRKVTAFLQQVWAGFVTSSGDINRGLQA